MQPALVVMAAGVGSRFGGLKQIEPVGPSGEIILDYSVFDAIRAGFGRVVFVIRKAMADDFKAVVDAHIPARVAVEYVFQELEDLPAGFAVPANRTKPWGTGHAVLRCSAVVKEPFAVINADDFYGRESYAIAARALERLSPQDTSFLMIGFRLANTLSEHGHVTRAICETDSDNMLVAAAERMKIEKKLDGGARFEDEPGGWVNLEGNEVVSMNMFGFTPAFFGLLEEMFPAFLRDAADKPGSEFLLPTIVHELIRGRDATMRVLETPEKWFGVTYREDASSVARGIRELVDKGVYPSPLWGGQADGAGNP